MEEIDLSSLEFENFDTDKLRPDPRNPKIHTPEQIEMIKASIKQVGWGRPILANKKMKMIIAGHGAWQAATELKMPKVPVIWTDMDPGKALLLMIADNRLAELAETDPGKLAFVFEELSTTWPDIDQTASGYTLLEIQNLRIDGQVDAQEDNYPAPEEYQAIKDPITRRGDIWVLGNHRLMCGDSTVPRDVKTLMGTRKARLCVTDPPYNINYDQNNGPRHGTPKSGTTNFNMQNDQMSQGEFIIFLDCMMGNIFSHTNGAIYIFMSCKEWPRVMSVFEARGGHWSSTIIWNKSNFVLSRKDYQPKFEPILYGWQEPSPGTVPDYTPILYGWQEGDLVPHILERNKSDVWDFSKPSKAIEHPTMKPVELIAECIKNSSSLNDVVLDLFIGSGTTIIAAEQTGRVCYGMELDPKYCDVAVNRWAAQTGRVPRRIPSGDKTLAEKFNFEPGQAEEVRANAAK